MRFLSHSLPESRSAELEYRRTAICPRRSESRRLNDGSISKVLGSGNLQFEIRNLQFVLNVVSPNLVFRLLVATVARRRNFGGIWIA